jgi:PKD repeat protein
MARTVSKTLVCLLGLAVLPACDDENPAAPVLAATCEARPASGQAPLAVSFLLNISGAEGTTSVAITYGDGQSGTNPDTPHTYATGGSYTATFNVSTATQQTARCSTVVNVTGTGAPTGGNKPPVAVFKVSPGEVGGRIKGTAPFTVNFNMCATSDPENDELYFLFDFEGDEIFDFGGITGFHCRADRTYAVGTWKPVICVHDRTAARQPLHDDTCATYTIDAQ